VTSRREMLANDIANACIGTDEKDVPDRRENKFSTERPERAGSFVV